jgi:exonuclease SbcC
VARLLGLTQGSEQTEAGLKTQLASKTADLVERLRAAAFADVEACRAAWLADEQVVVLDTSIQAFDANLAAGAQRHDRASVDTRDLVRPDIVAAAGQHEAAKAAHIAASNAVRDAVAAHNTIKSLAESLRRLAGDYQALQVRYALVKKVADVATGDNKQRMSFQRYVLATLLEEVLVATTLRLRVMSRGRYEIRRKLQAADLRSAAGLDLEVFDQYTGMTRAVTTLSGGESFLASLALALGLSDVVQSYAGGIRLDAIFVDEGFGMLDPEALDFAVRALKDLQQAGRLVGIISHVAELREWIDARLELKAGQAGSVAEFVV